MTLEYIKDILRYITAEGRIKIQNKKKKYIYNIDKLVISMHQKCTILLLLIIIE